VIFGGLVAGWPGLALWCKNIPEKLNPLSRVHACHRRVTTDRQTDGFAIALAKRNVYSRLANNISLLSTHNKRRLVGLHVAKSKAYTIRCNLIDFI